MNLYKNEIRLSQYWSINILFYSPHTWTILWILK
jgi:hypothetical protein